MAVSSLPRLPTISVSFPTDGLSPSLYEAFLSTRSRLVQVGISRLRWTHLTKAKIRKASQVSLLSLVSTMNQEVRHPTRPSAVCSFLLQVSLRCTARRTASVDVDRRRRARGPRLLLAHVPHTR